MLNLKNLFKNNGYCIYDPNLDIEIINKARLAFDSILKKSENNIYKKVRVYDDYYFNKINIAGIENIFDKEIIHQDILDIINKSNIVNIAKSILEEEDIILSLSRYHVTNNFTHLGIWHRDGEYNNLQSVQINIYLYNETGMDIVPNSHTRKNFEHEDLIIKSKPFSNLEHSSSVSVLSGKVLAFDPSLIHRGKTINNRVHLHFRFMKNNKLKKTINNNFSLKFLDKFSINQDLKNLLINTEKNGYNYESEEYSYKKNFKCKILRMLRFFIHKYLFFLSYDNKIYLKFNTRPCLNMRRLFRLS